ncbi:MAG TPA: hypothetical protein VFX12_14840 [Vicinamibacterales bacterium]|nr:hypothetical protein [Vicinamibacterales bacterium]
MRVPIDRLSLALMTALAATLAASIGATARSGQEAAESGGINRELRARLEPKDGYPIRIAPMTKQGDPTPGTYTDVDGRNIFDAIFERAGIEPCRTDPEALRGHEGFLEHVKKGSSQVLNRAGSRSTFGYFIRVYRQNPHANFEELISADYFVLFSYDRITKKRPDGTDEVICATELFLFGPRDVANTALGTDPKLLAAYAVGADGRLLQEVPLDLAKVSNFPGEEDKKDQPVTPGISSGQGCMVCHTENLDSFPQSTTPFPWVKPTPAAPLNPAGPPAPAAPSPTTPAAAVPAPPAATGTPGSTSDATPAAPATPGGASTSGGAAPSRPAAEGVAPSPPAAPIKTISAIVLPKQARDRGVVSGLGIVNPDKYRAVPGLQVVLLPGGAPAGEVVDFGDGRRQPVDGPLTMRPSGGTPLAMTVFADARAAAPIARVSLPVMPAAANPKVSGSRPPACTMPLVASAGGVQVIHDQNEQIGADITRMRITVDETPATIVAATAGAVFWDVPDTLVPGPHRVVFAASPGQPTITLSMYVVGLQMSADDTSLLRGQSTKMHVTITGLESMPATLWRSATPPPDLVDLADFTRRAGDTRLPRAGGPGEVRLLLENQSPAQVRMGKRGDRVLLALHQHDFANGPYQYQDRLQSLRAGGFRISGTVVAFLEEALGSR